MRVNCDPLYAHAPQQNNHFTFHLEAYDPPTEATFEAVTNDGIEGGDGRYQLK